MSSASLLPPGTPNAAIAQGAIFNVFGSGMGPSSIVLAPLPLPTNLSGTSIDVTVGGATVHAPMFYSVASQLAAILPSNTPLGTGSVTVNFGGASATSPITVVQSNVGIYTANLSGGGPGVVTYANTTSVVTNSNSTKAGDVLTLWATGLGPITTSDANPPNPVDLGTPITIYLGGVQANLLYRGRSGYAGLDQINFIVPDGVSPGCGVSLVIRTGNLVSNNTTIPVSASGGACSNANANFTPSQLSTLLSKSSIKIGAFQYSQDVSNTLNQSGKAVITTSNSASAVLIGLDQVNFPVLLSQLATVTPGSCAVTVINGQQNSKNSLFSISRPLNAGANLTLTPPSGPPLILTSSGGTGGKYSAGPASYQAGVFTMSGTGGPDLGAFTSAFTVPPLLIWTNQSAISGSTIDRTQPLTVTWTGGDPNGYVDVYVRAGLNNNGVQLLEVDADCAAPVSAGSFTVPPSVMLAMPPAGTNFAYSQVGLQGNNSPVLLPVPGMDGVIVQAGNSVQADTNLK